VSDLLNFARGLAESEDRRDVVDGIAQLDGQQMNTFNLAMAVLMTFDRFGADERGALIAAMQSAHNSLCELGR